MRRLLALVPLIAFFALVLSGSLAVAVLALFVSGAAWLVLRGALVRRRVARVQAALQRFDGAALLREVEVALRDRDLRQDLRERLRFHQALGHLILQQYAEALEVLNSIDVQRVSERDFLAISGNRAFAMAQLGRIDEAIALAKENFARAQSPELVSVHRGILGVALQLGGDSERAITELEAALADGSLPPPLQAIDSFYLGEALSACGRTEAAEAAYARARDAAPGTAFSNRAATHLLKAPSRAPPP